MAERKGTLSQPYQSTLTSSLSTPFDINNVVEEEEKVETLGDYGREAVEGVASGLLNIAEGIAELGTATVDIAAGTDYTNSLNTFFDNVKDSAGIDPQGFVGNTAEAISQFVIPGLGAAGAISKGSRIVRGVAKLSGNKNPRGTLARGTKLGRLQRAVERAKTPDERQKLLRRMGRNPDGLSKSERFAIGAQQVAAATATDFVVANNGTSTLSDFFAGGSIDDEDIGLSGRAKGLETFANKFKVGAETGVMTVVAPVAVGALAKGTGVVLTETPIVKDVVRGAAIGAKKGFDAANNWAAKAELNYIRGDGDKFSDAVAAGLSILRDRGFLPQEVATARQFVSGQIEGYISKARSVAEGLDKKVDKFVKESARTPGTRWQKTQVYGRLDDYLTGETEEIREAALEGLPDNLQMIARQMRSSITQLSSQILNSRTLQRLDGIIDPKTGNSKGADIREAIQRNIDTYLRRRFRMFELKGKWDPTEEVRQAARDGFTRDKDRLAFELGKVLEEDMLKGSDGFGYTEAALGIQKNADGKWEMTSFDPPTEQQLNLGIQGFLDRYRPDKASEELTGRIATHKVNSKLFKERVSMPKYQRNLLGEITDVREAYLGTVADMAEFIATDEYFGAIDDLVKARKADGSFANPGVRALFKDMREEGATQAIETAGEQTRVPKGMKLLSEEDGEWGALSGYAVSNKIHKDMTRLVIRDMGVYGNAARGLYSGLLKAKGWTQYGKTVLSLPTQIRNVTSAALFATMQGNIGRGATIGESFDIVWRPFREKADLDQLKEFQKMQRLNVFGNQAELKEIKEATAKGMGFSEEATVGGVSIGRGYADGFYQHTYGSIFNRTKGVVKQGGRIAEAFYQGGDDLWKYYNYKFERQKLVNALDTMSREEAINFLTQGRGIPLNKTYEDLIDEEAAGLVRNLVPNYNNVPEVIKGLRKLPVGNFIAFPYEIMRTTAHTMKRGIDELASEHAAIREIGLRRLTGALTTTTMVPMALSRIAHAQSGIDPSETKAYKRTVAMPWERNATLLPIGRAEDGMPIYINYSYTNPYDLLSKTVTGVMNAYETGQLQGKDSGQVVFDAMSEGINELFAPFTQESIAAGLLRDVVEADPDKAILPGESALGQLIGGRGGQRISGARVYNEEDPWEVKLEKKVTHFFGGMLPPVGVQVRGGEFEAGRFVQAIDNAFADPDENQRDRYGRVRTLQNELTRVMTGLAATEAEASMAVRYRGYEYGTRLRNAGNIFVSTSNRQNATEEDFLASYQRAQDARFKIKNEMFLVVKDMERMGLTRSQIRRIFKKANVGGMDDVFRGKFKPQDISRTVRSRAREFNLPLPTVEINRLRRLYNNKPFGAPVGPTRDPATQSQPQNRTGTLSAPFSMQSQPQPQSQNRTGTLSAPFSLAPVSPPSPQGATPAVGPTSSNTVGPAAPPDSTLLGSNPVTAMRNAQIAARRNTT